MPITSAFEKREIEQALEIPDKYQIVKTQLSHAIDLLSDRDNPDYKNSIKESISAVESVCKIVLNKDITLGQSIKEIGREKNLHPAFVGAINQFYGYTSGSAIRHGPLEDIESLEYDDAKFFVLFCSGIINFLILKTEA
jgi:hypothetical protein